MRIGSLVMIVVLLTGAGCEPDLADTVEDLEGYCESQVVASLQQIEQRVAALEADRDRLCEELGGTVADSSCDGLAASRLDSLDGDLGLLQAEVEEARAGEEDLDARIESVEDAVDQRVGAIEAEVWDGAIGDPSRIDALEDAIGSGGEELEPRVAALEAEVWDGPATDPSRIDALATSLDDGSGGLVDVSGGAADWDQAFAWGDHAPADASLQAAVGTVETEVWAGSTTGLSRIDALAVALDDGAGGLVDVSGSADEWSEAFAWGDHAAEVGDLQAGVDALVEALEDGAGGLVDVSGSAAGWNEAYAWGDHAQADADLQAGIDDLDDAVGALQIGKLGLIDSDLTLAVPGEYADVNDALAWLDGYAIAGGATVTIEIAAGTYTYAEPVVLRHRDGDRIEILGDGVATTSITFPDSDGLVVTGATALGLVSDLTLVGSANLHEGILVTDSSFALLGDVDLVGWGDIGILVTSGAAQSLVEGAVVHLTDCYTGATAEWGGQAILPGAIATGCHNGYISVGGGLYAGNSSTTGVGDQGYGYMANLGGTLQANSAMATDHQRGFYSHANGTLYVMNAQAHSCGYLGFESSTGSVLWASGSSSTDNAEQGYVSSDGALLYALSSTASANGLGDYRTVHNGFINATALGDASVSSASHDTSDFVVGIP